MQETVLNGESMNIVEDNIEKLKSIFPDIITDGGIDFDKLQSLLGRYIETKDERYNFIWNGKSAALRLAQTPSTGTLRPCKEDSKNWDTTQNLYIEGDNLEVLKLLQKSYHNKIKMIYIDPPYNTGNDFVYKDDFRDNIENYKKVTGQVDESGNTLSSNTESSGRYHTNWLNMMYPRLRLSRNLLTDDGVIFISIDDNEFYNLRKICDEIFGANNFLVSFYVQVRYEDKDLAETKPFKPVIEQILAYAKDSLKFIPKRPTVEYSDDNFIFEIKELAEGELYKIDNQEVMVFKPGQWEIITHNKGDEKFLKETWVSGSIYSKMSYGQVVKKYIEPRIDIDGMGCLYKVLGRGDDGLGYRYYTGPQKQSSKRCKMYSGMPLSRIEEIRNGGSIRYLPITNFEDYAPDFGNIVNEGGVKYNSGKKPVKMLKHFLDLSNLKDDDIVLDFFAGSASTAHSVMDMNANENKNIRFIMVQLPEQLIENVKSQKDSYDFLKSINRPTILSELGKERIRRAGDKIKEEIESGNLQLKLGESSKEVPDIGFKVFKLDTSNIKKWNGNADTIESEIQGSIFNYEVGRSELDVVYEIMLKCGLDLTYPIEEINVNGKTLYSIGTGAMFVCMDDKITQDIADKIVEIKDANDIVEPVAVFKDNGFTTDSNKTNIKETLRVAGIKDFITV